MIFFFSLITQIKLIMLMTAPCSSGNNLEEVKQTLGGYCQILTKWLYRSCIVLNSGKYHFETYFFNNTEMEKFWE